MQIFTQTFTDQCRSDDKTTTNEAQVREVMTTNQFISRTHSSSSIHWPSLRGKQRIKRQLQSTDELILNTDLRAQVTVRIPLLN